MNTGLDRLLKEPALRAPLAGKRIALLGHPASVTDDLKHALDALATLPDLELVAAFGPQHGMRGEKQDNMVESGDYRDPLHGIPVFSLYGQVRRPTDAMLDTFDVLLVDLQDLGCRVYTFITTLGYVLEAAAAKGKGVSTMTVAAVIAAVNCSDVLETHVFAMAVNVESVIVHVRGGEVTDDKMRIVVGA